MQCQIQTKKQNVKLTFQGYLYTFDRTSADGMRKFWRCEFKNSNDKCKGRIWTNLNDIFIRLATPHTCPASAARVDAQKVTTAIKRRAIATFEPPSVIHSEALQNVPSPSGILIGKEAAKKLIKRARHEVNAPPVVPANLQQLVISPAYQMYTPADGAEEQFLLGDSGVFFEPGNEKPQRILLFGRASFGRWADRMKECFGDGTFSLAPPLFYQIYTILAKFVLLFFQFCPIHFIDVLRREQKSVDVKYALFIAGEEPPPKKRKYLATDQRIFNLVRTYVPVNANNDDHNYHQNRNHYHIILEFLRGISRNYHMNP